MRKHLEIGILLLLFTGTLGAAQVRTPKGSDHPETVIVTLRPKAGAEAELAGAIGRHYETARELDLILPEPHITVRGVDASGHPYFVDIFSWRDPSVPDSAPPRIQSIWADMNRLVESRNGAPGLEFSEVSLVTSPKSRPPAGRGR